MKKYICDQDRATINDNNNIRVIRGVHFNTCTDTETSSNDLASPLGLSPSVENKSSSSGRGTAVAQAKSPWDRPQFKSIKYDLYDNSDPMSDHRQWNLSVATLDPNTNFKVRLNSEYRFFKRGVEDLLDEEHYENMLNLYEKLNNGTSDILKLAKAYVNNGTREKPQMQTVIYQSVILQKTFDNRYHIYHGDEHRMYHCELSTRNDIQFTQAQLKTPLFATGWIAGTHSKKPSRMTIQDIARS